MAVLLAAGLAIVGCTQSQPEVRKTPPPEPTAGSTRAASSILLAAAEGQRDAVPLESSAYGEYLAGLVAAHSQDYGTAADFMIRALDSDPDNVDLLRRAFVLTAAEGRHSESLELARRLVDQEPANAVALLVLAVDAVVRDQPDAAGDQLAAQPGRGLSILYEPLLNAWLRVGAGDISGAQKNASGLDGREGFESLYLMHKALLYDVGDDAERAAEAYRDLLGRLDSPSLRFAVLAGNFFERQGQPEAATEIYASYTLANPDTTLMAVFDVAERGDDAPAPILRGYKDGWAEVLFDLAGILSQERADEMALLHAHLAIRLKPDLDLARIAARPPSRPIGGSTRQRGSLGRRGCASPTRSAAWSAPKRPWSSWNPWQPNGRTVSNRFTGSATYCACRNALARRRRLTTGPLSGSPSRSATTGACSISAASRWSATDSGNERKAIS
jgi:tetratricopeptide (TPR) repeat protein